MPQALIAGQIDEPGVPRVDPYPPQRHRNSHRGLPRRIRRCRVLPPARVRRAAPGVGDAGAVAVGHDTRWVAATLTPHGRHRRSPRRSGCAPPGGGAGAGSCAMASVNEDSRSSPPATPAGLVPVHLDVVVTVRDIFRRGPHVLLHRGGDDPAPRACRRGFVGGDHVHHPGPATAPLDTLNPHSGNPTTMSYLNTALGSFPPPEIRKLQLRKTKGLPIQDRPRRTKSQLPV